MPVYMDQRILRRNLLLKEHLNMILLPNVITMVIITAMGMSAGIIMVKDITVVIIMEKASTADIRRVTKAAAVITESKSP